MTTILAADGLDVFYGASQILFGVSFAVEEGQTVALLGRNGAGKSTTFKALAGLAPPRVGRVAIRGTVPDGGESITFTRGGTILLSPTVAVTYGTGVGDAGNTHTTITLIKEGDEWRLAAAQVAPSSP